MQTQTKSALSISGNSLPLPLYVAQQWVFPLAYIDSDGNASHYWYAIQDWINGLTESERARKMWSDMKKQLSDSNGQLKIKIEILPYLATDGKHYQVSYTSAEGLYRIAQELRVTKERARLDSIRKYLAAAGVFVDTIRRDPAAAAAAVKDLEAKHGDLREKSRDTRNEFERVATATHKTHKPDYKALTNTEYEVLFGAAKNELVKELGLNATQARKFRDNISALAVQAIDAAETACIIKMSQLGRKLTTLEQIEIVRKCARIVAPAFWEVAEYLNVDFLSGKSLLDDGV